MPSIDRLVHCAAVPVLVTVALAASLLATSTPASAQRIRPDFWGMHASDWVSGPAVPFGAANLTTSGTYWPNIEVKKGVFYWDRLDAQVAAVEARGARPMLLLGQSPRFHSTRRRSPEHHDFMPKKSAWKRYVRRVAERYGDRIDYQIWPEPNIIQNWKGSPRQMAVLTALASREIRRAAPRATVVSPGVALRLDEQRQWTMKYFNQRVGGRRMHRFIDAVAIDPFPMQAGTPEDAYRIMKGVKRRLKRVGVREPIWVNEINYGVAGGHAPTKTKYPTHVQRAYVIRTYVLAAAAGMKRSYWLGWGRYDAMGVQMLTKSHRASGAAKAYRRVVRWLGGTRFMGCRLSGARLWTCTVRSSAEVRRIHWTVNGSIQMSTPASTKRVERQSGPVDRRRGTRVVRIDHRPVMVVAGKG